MSMLMSIGGLIVVIALAATILKNPNQENKTLISVLLVLQLIFIILNMYGN